MFITLPRHPLHVRPIECSDCHSLSEVTATSLNQRASLLLSGVAAYDVVSMIHLAFA